MANEIFFDNIQDYGERNRFALYEQGANPRILERLMAYVNLRINRLRRIRVCSYLYNNASLNDYFISLAQNGIDVDVISIPLEGYDDNRGNAKRLLNYYSRLIGQYNYTKYDLAQSVYHSMIEASRNYENLHFYIFPHMYVRSRNIKPFSRGNLPYSLHIKSMVFEYTDGSGAVALTSSNLSCRDLTKDELFFVMEDNTDALESARLFYDNLIACSISANEFDENGDWMHYNIAINDNYNEINDNYNMGVNSYIAPFYRNSPIIAKNRIKELIRNASEEIYISAEHLATESEDDVIGCVFSERRNGVNVKCLSQVFYCDDMEEFIQEQNGRYTNFYYLNDNNQRIKLRTPENRAAFCNMTRSVDNDDRASYFVNSDVHAKYMVIDDTAVISTCNFTPTSFLYYPEIDIPRFNRIPNVSYHGIYSEVGQIIFVRDAEICEALKNNFDIICEQQNTYRR